jgi:preprotein translocase SecE subunit
VPFGPLKPKIAGGDIGPGAVTRVTTFLREVYLELKPPKTKWPTWQEAQRLTIVVLSVIVVVAMYIGTLDYIFTWLTKHFNLIK